MTANPAGDGKAIKKIFQISVVGIINKKCLFFKRRPTFYKFITGAIITLGRKNPQKNRKLCCELQASHHVDGSESLNASRRVQPQEQGGSVVFSGLEQLRKDLKVSKDTMLLLTLKTSFNISPHSIPGDQICPLYDYSMLAGRKHCVYLRAQVVFASQWSILFTYY